MIGNKYLWSVVVSVFLLGISLQTVSADAPRVKGELKKAQAALAKFKDPLKAIKAGYLSTVACVSFPKGAMGIHFINGRLIGQPLDPAKPQILMYEPVGRKLRLVAVEWIVPAGPEKMERPTLFGQKFHGPMPGHEPLMPKQLMHYDFHAWLFKKNPLGTFALFNPNVKCKGRTNYTLNEKLPPPMKMKK